MGWLGFSASCPFSLDGFMEQPVVRDVAGNLEPKTFLDSIGLEDEEDWPMVRQGSDPLFRICPGCNREGEHLTRGLHDGLQ